jgi:large subunit ribosomal protein L15
LPHKRGFTNIFRIEYAEVNVGQLSRFPAGAEVGPGDLVQARLIKSTRLPVKILGQGAIEHPLKVVAHKFTESARAKIEAAGGSIVQVGASPAENQQGEAQTEGAASVDVAND